MYIYISLSLQCIQFTWKQARYLASKMMLHRILHLLYLAISSQYFCSLCDISKTVFLIKWDCFDLHVKVICYEKGLCFLHEICSSDESVFAQRFLVLLLSNLFLKRQKTKHFFKRCIITLSLMIVSRGKMFQQLLLMVIRYL